MIRKTIFAAAALAAIAAPAAAQPWQASPAAGGRYCQYADVVGLWDSTLQRADEQGVAQQNAVAPHDYMRFAANGAMMYFGSSRALNDVSAIRARLEQLDRADGESYRAEMAGPGVLIIRRNGAPFQGFTCTVGPKVGGRSTMIWTQLRGQPS
jgi:hypothetical protein